RAQSERHALDRGGTRGASGGVGRFGLLVVAPPPGTAVFPYTPLFRSAEGPAIRGVEAVVEAVQRGVVRPEHLVGAVAVVGALPGAEEQLAGGACAPEQLCAAARAQRTRGIGAPQIQRRRRCPVHQPEA